MNLPSRGALASATTTSYCASFLRPLRASLILTAIFLLFYVGITSRFLKDCKGNINLKISYPMKLKLPLPDHLLLKMKQLPVDIVFAGVNKSLYLLKRLK